MAKDKGSREVKKPKQNKKVKAAKTSDTNASEYSKTYEKK